MNSNELFIKEIRLDRQNVIAFDEYPFNIPRSEERRVGKEC